MRRRPSPSCCSGRRRLTAALNRTGYDLAEKVFDDARRLIRLLHEEVVTRARELDHAVLREAAERVTVLIRLRGKCRVVIGSLRLLHGVERGPVREVRLVRPRRGVDA